MENLYLTGVSPAELPIPGGSSFMMSPRERAMENFPIQASGCCHDRAAPSCALHLHRAAHLAEGGRGWTLSRYIQGPGLYIIHNVNSSI